ncbi:MAG: serine/threonine protein kinase [Deltaproteobacteria bacterium]|nr:serine/threonine protein kinase [Deltaproteobacteria bacterium]
MKRSKPHAPVPTRPMPAAGAKRDPQATRPMPGRGESHLRGGTHGAGTAGESGDWSLPAESLESLPAIAITNLDDTDGRIGERYTILSMLGQGASATVYEVRDEHTGDTHALKLLDLDSQVEVTRFRREQALLRKLEHPNLVTVTDSGEWDGREFMVMTILRGGSLLDWLRDSGGGMDYVRACRLFRGAAEALHQAHLAGVVHRDIKPGNLALEPGSEEKLLVLDFGIAKSMNTSASLTDAGMVMGSPAYMCPERLFSGAKATDSWDVYSLGVVMYEVITGTPLFRGRSWMDTMTKIQRFTPPFISTIRDDAPPALDWLISEMIAKEPQGRPSGCDVIARRLLRIERQLG